jgi:hypothetical protein
MRYVDIPVFTLDTDTSFAFSGTTQITGGVSIKLPGLPANDYSHISVNGATYRVASITGEWVTIYTSFPSSGSSVFVDVRMGYAKDDGRNLRNWSCDGLTLQSVVPGRFTFEGSFTVGRAYTLTLLNAIRKDAFTTWPKGAQFAFSCTENYSPTEYVSAEASDGLVTITFSDTIQEEEGYVYGLDFDRIEYDDDKLLIYTSEAGDVEFELQGFFDTYGNPIEDAEVSVTLEAIADTIRYLDDGYSIRRKSKLDYEDTVLSEAYQWIRNQNLD